MDALEFLARVVSHIPNKGQVLQRYYGRCRLHSTFWACLAGLRAEPCAAVSNSEASASFP